MTFKFGKTVPTYLHGILMSILQADTSLNFSICSLAEHLMSQFVEIWRKYEVLVNFPAFTRTACVSVLAYLPSKVPVELSVALVLFFFFRLPVSGMFTGWLFSHSVEAEMNPYTQIKTLQFFCTALSLCKVYKAIEMLGQVKHLYLLGLGKDSVFPLRYFCSPECSHSFALLGPKQGSYPVTEKEAIQGGQGEGIGQNQPVINVGTVEKKQMKKAKKENFNLALVINTKNKH